jgi:enediyne biosynthesis protein E7
VPTEAPEADQQFDIGSAADSLARLIELYPRYGDTYRVFVPKRGSHTYVIHHPEDVKRVLISNRENYTKGTGIDRIKLLLGHGIMTSEGALWTRQRYMMQPCFHRRVVDQFATVVASANEQRLAEWEARAHAGTPINITEEVSDLTLEIVLLSIFGTDLARLTPEAGANPFLVVAKDPARNLDFVFKFRALTRLVVQLIRRRREQQEEHFDFLDMLMRARDRDSGEGMSDGRLVDEVMTLIVAGHETTASALSWTWYLLALHPQAESRLHAELDANPELPAPSLTEVEELPYTNQVVREALRLYPPGWLLSRRTVEADVLGGFTVPAHTEVLLPIYLLHRDPRFWQQPDAFLPERFEPAQEAQRPRFLYIPFGAGPRHCIGETLALYEMLMHLYKVARRFRLAYVPDRPIELDAQINLRTRYPLHMRLIPRH